MLSPAGAGITSSGGLPCALTVPAAETHRNAVMRWKRARKNLSLML